MARKIAVIGTGYVGLVVGVGLADFGHYVTCIDKDKEKIKQLNEGKIPIYEPGLEEYLKRNIETQRLKFRDNIVEAIHENEVIFIAVGTPSNDDGDVDLSQVEEVAVKIAENLNGYKLVVIKSTVPVGTSKWLYNFIKKRNGDKNFDVVSNPEFLREGKALNDFFHPDRVVIGYKTEKAKEIMQEIYRSLYLIETPFVFCNWETAELIKYASNAFLATKITFINQIANLCEAVGADVHIVAKAMGMDGRISPKFLHPGPGFGGSCLPKDTRALEKIGEKNGVDMSLIKAVLQANEQQRKIVLRKLEKHLGPLGGKKIAILGLAFKAETDDIRESPSVYIVNELLKRKVNVRTHDPKALHNAKKLWGNKVQYFSSVYDAIKETEAIVILTEWNEYRNLDLLKTKRLMKGNLIVDMRNVLDSDKVKEFNLKYEGIGRK